MSGVAESGRPIRHGDDQAGHLAKPRILHITESFGGGVASAITQYASSYSEGEHYLLRKVRGQHYEEDTSLAVFSRVFELPDGPLRSLRRVREVVTTLRPDVVHAHSSLGGVYARSALRRSKSGPRIVYTPHCFAFERGDISAAARQFYRAVEALLSWNTDVVAGCSEREVTLAKRMRPQRAAIYLPNIARDAAAFTQDSPRSFHSPARVVGGGRFSPQKDPHWFADVVASIRARGHQVDALWIGGDAAEVPSCFRELEIHTTGWVARPVALAQLSDADLYVHSAAWEGFPMAVLEAEVLRRPIFARSIPALHGAPDRWVFNTPEDAALAFEELLTGPTNALQENANEWSEWLRANDEAAQSDALARIYNERLI